MSRHDQFIARIHPRGERASSVPARVQHCECNVPTMQYDKPSLFVADIRSYYLDLRPT